MRQTTHTRSNLRSVVLLAVALVAITACADGFTDPLTTPSPIPVEDPVVTIADMAFQNGSMTVTAGTTVTWVWDDAPTEHNVVGDRFESPLQAEGSWTHTFEEPGSYDYRCGPHPSMRGTITVIESP